MQIRLQFECPRAVVLNRQQGLPLGPQCHRQAVGEAEGDELLEAGRITVRQVAALVPALRRRLVPRRLLRACSAPLYLLP